MLSQDVSSQHSPSQPHGAAVPVVAQAWDPYEVWLKRVKQPRDRLPQRGVAPAVIASLDAEPRPEASALLPHAS